MNRFLVDAEAAAYITVTVKHNTVQHQSIIVMDIFSGKLKLSDFDCFLW